jgi:hypothetical protein
VKRRVKANPPKAGARPTVRDHYHFAAMQGVCQSLTWPELAANTASAAEVAHNLAEAMYARRKR